MGFNRDVLRRRRDQLDAWGVRIRWSGRKPRLWSSVIADLELAERITKRNTALTLTMCVNYGGRAEIIDAVRQLAGDVRSKKVEPGRITEKTLQKYLYIPDAPDVDLFVRTSGEHRTSNFLPWQSVYAEMVFLDTLWPDMTRVELWRAITEYQGRTRRFGGAVDQPAPR